MYQAMESLITHQFWLTRKNSTLYLEISSPGAVNDWGFGGLSGVLSPVVEGMVK